MTHDFYDPCCWHPRGELEFYSLYSTRWSIKYDQDHFLLSLNGNGDTTRADVCSYPTQPFVHHYGDYGSARISCSFKGSVPLSPPPVSKWTTAVQLRFELQALRSAYLAGDFGTALTLVDWIFRAAPCSITFDAASECSTILAQTWQLQRQLQFGYDLFGEPPNFVKATNLAGITQQIELWLSAGESTEAGLNLYLQEIYHDDAASAALLGLKALLRYVQEQQPS